LLRHRLDGAITGGVVDDEHARVHGRFGGNRPQAGEQLLADIPADDDDVHARVVVHLACRARLTIIPRPARPPPYPGGGWWRSPSPPPIPRGGASSTGRRRCCGGSAASGTSSRIRSPSSAPTFPFPDAAVG